MIMPCIVMNWVIAAIVDEGEGTWKSQLQPHQPRQHKSHQSDSHGRNRVDLDGDDFRILRKYVFREPAVGMVKIYFGNFRRWDSTDGLRGDLAHQNALLSSIS